MLETRRVPRGSTAKKILSATPCGGDSLQHPQPPLHLLHINLVSFDVYGMDRRTPYTLSVLPPSEEVGEDSRTHIQARLREFVLEFQLDNAFIYRCVKVDEIWRY